MTALLIATGNAHKVRELGRILPGVSLSSLADFERYPAPDETADDYAGNAIIKAREAHARTGAVALADDSGIEVAALDWAPGIHSARYVDGSDDDRRHALVRAVGDNPDRRARYVCAVAVAGLPATTPLPDGAWWQDDCMLARGVCEGTIGRVDRGTRGFGYDPVFHMPDGRTMAELGDVEKDRVSHRGLAARVLHDLLRDRFPG